jgi:hypothetical protein
VLEVIVYYCAFIPYCGLKGEIHQIFGRPLYKNVAKYICRAQSAKLPIRRNGQIFLPIRVNGQAVAHSQEWANIFAHSREWASGFCPFL